MQIFEKRQGIENRFDIRAFRREIAAGADGFAADCRHQPSPSVAGCQARSVRTQRRDDKTQRQLIADRRKLRAKPRLGRYFPRRLRMIGMHLKMSGQRAQCVLELVVRTRRHGEASRDQLRSPSLRGREPDHAQPLWRVLHERDRFQRLHLTLVRGVAVVILFGIRVHAYGRRDSHDVTIAVLHHLDFRRAFDHVDELIRRIGQHDGRMAYERHDRRRPVDLPPARISPVLTERSRDLRIPRRQTFVACDLGKVQRFGFRPPARTTLLLERFDRFDGTAFADPNRPDNP